MLVIADDERAIGLAGIMGGENSEIMDDTTTVVFESANFNGTSIRQTALALGMRTEASGKFEKNLDAMMTVPAVQRACELVELLQCGDVMDGIIDIVNYVPAPKTLELEPEKINRLLGTDISEEDMVKYLNRLEIEVEGRTIHVPSFRPDLNLTADIAEEVGRLYGYNEIPTTAFKNATQGGYSPFMLTESKAGALCRSLGYSEIITYSFVSPTIFDQIRLPADSVLRNAIRIQNPLGEDTSIMRTIAIPSMLDILSRNNAYHNKNVKLYEIAKIYLPTEGQVLPEEPKMLVLGTYGQNTSFFSLKGELEAIFKGLNVKKAVYTAVNDNPTYHPGRCAKVTVDGVDVGYMGQIHPVVASNYGMDMDVYAVEVSLTKLYDLLLPEATYVPLPKYPAVTRDLALLCDESATVGQAQEVIAKAGGKLLRDVQLFDIYRGTGVPEGKKSLAFSLILRADDRTLTDTDSEGVISKVLSAVQVKLGATLR
jgi:phenylalanyl-tRNA synthetase beta chain